MSTPQIVDRPAVTCAVVAETVTMESIGSAMPRMNQEVFGWLAARGIEPAGAPFAKYNLIDMERALDIEAGVATLGEFEGDDRVHADVLPAGRYATMRHIGHPMTLIDATASLLRWAEEQGLRWDVAESDRGERWRCRLEIYHTDPREQPDMNAWETELAFRLADEQRPG